MRRKPDAAQAPHMLKKSGAQKRAKTRGRRDKRSVRLFLAPPVE
jgi:hypothetical protein